MAESGLVVSRDGDKVTVKMERTEACAKCKACMAGFSKQEMIIHAVNNCDADIDDTVNIELEETGFLMAVLIMYGIPLVGMMIGFLMGSMVVTKTGIGIDSEVAGFILGIIFMLVTYLLIKMSESKRKTEKYTPIATEVLRK